MIRPLRVAHRWLWTALLVLLPLAYLAILDRRPSRPSPRILAGLSWNADVFAKMEVVERLDPGWRGVPVTLEIRTDDRGGVWLTAVRRDPFWAGAADLQVLYRSPRAAAPNMEEQRPGSAELDVTTTLVDSVVLGPLAERAWPLPPRAAEGGSILLYSAAEDRVLAQTRIPLASRLLFPFVP